jgi:hypothetical protein
MHSFFPCAEADRPVGPTNKVVDLDRRAICCSPSRNERWKECTFRFRCRTAGGSDGGGGGGGGGAGNNSLRRYARSTMTGLFEKRSYKELIRT